MKVEGPNRTQNSDKTKKKDKTPSGDGTFGKMVTGEASETKGAGASHSIAAVDSLLAVQAAESPTERAARKRMQQRGDNILKELDKLRMALLTGDLTVGHVIDIADVVSSHREKITDPRLTAILDEVDLRAQIELAKMRVALDNHAPV